MDEAALTAGCGEKRSMKERGFDTTTDEVLEGIDLRGKTALITGGSSGLGAETARALASKGAAVVITARNMAKGEGVAAAIRRNTNNANVFAERLELGSIGNIRALADRLLVRHPRLDLLINNAGVMACPYAQTEDGFELQFGSNHLGHFLLTNLLMPALGNGAPSRVVVLSSRAHQLAPVDFADPNFTNRPYHKWFAYGQAKTANALFAVGLNLRHAEQGVEAFSVHPGMIRTELSRHMDDDDRAFLARRAGDSGGTLAMKSVEAGAATSVYAATAVELSGRGGAYLEDCKIAEVNDDPGQAGGVRSYAVDAGDADRLWTLSEELLASRIS